MTYKQFIRQVNTMFPVYIHGPSYCQGTCIQLFSDPKVVYQLSLVYRQYYPLFHVNTVSLSYFIKTNFTVT